MALAQASYDSASAMGKRAGEAWRDQAIPTRNPFGKAQPLLAQAWRRAYITASKPS